MFSSRAWCRCLRRLLILFVPIVMTASASAQTVFDQNGFGAGHNTYSALPYEHVDPLSGNLLIVTTDLVLPGNAGLDINVQRVYNSAVYPNYADNGDKTLEEDSWAGVGWRLHFGRVLDSTNLSSGGTQIEMGDGGRHPLYHDPARSEGWITKDFWVYDRNTNTLKLPNGVVYTFGRSVVISPFGTVRYVTQISDAYGNAITFDYFDANGPVDGVRQIHQDLGGGNVRDVYFGYNPTSKSLSTLQYGDSVWTYTQTDAGAGYTRLTTVKPPVGGSWSYGYEAAPFAGLTSLTAPSGGIVSYVYADSTRYAGTTTQLTRVVSTRTVSGPSITQGTWSFSYNGGADKDQSTVDCPCGKTVYRYAGIGTGTGSGGFESWRTGLLVDRQVLSPSGQVLEREERTWLRSEAISPDPVPAANGIWGDPAVYNGLPLTRVLRRDAKSWTTTYGYRTGFGTYNDYGMAQTLAETDGTRTRYTSNTFRYGFTPYLSARLASSTMSQGTESATITWTYESATGFLLDKIVRGIPSYYGRAANGNINSITDAHGHQTLLQYTWGVVSRTQTPLVTTEREIYPAGLIKREQTGAIYTDYEYDLAFRPKAIKPLNANATFYEYDTLWDGWYRIARGPSQTQYNVDGFGRPISTSNFVGLKTLTGRDACGRTTFSSLPYTDAQYDNRGTQTTYDALGRVTRSRFYDGLGGGGPDTAETTYAYDGLDVTSTDPLLRVTKRLYTAFSGPADAVLAGVIDAANQQTTYTYDPTKQLRAVSGAVAPRSWTYDAKGLLQQDSHPETGVSTYEYDAAGLLTKVTDAQGRVFVLTYDANDRLATRDGPGTDSDVTQTYDTLGRLATQTTALVATSYQYDGAGRQSGRTDVFQGQTYQSTYGYDANSNLTSLTYPSGRVVTYTYDVENRLTGVTQNGSPFASTFTYDDGGGLKSYVTGAVTHQMEYDRRQRVKHVTAGAATPSLDLTYQYSPVNQVTMVSDTRPGFSWSYAYDNLNRLTSAYGPYTLLWWSYDGKGNRTTETLFDATTTYSYNQTTQRLTSTSGPATESFSYDQTGRVLSDSRGSYTYTPAGMLASVTAPNLSASYMYDGDSLRILRTVNDVSTYSLRSIGGQTLTEYESPCGSAIWARDVIYAGSRVLGVIKASPTRPTIAVTAATSSVSEGAGVASINVAVTTPGGTPLACAATVAYETAGTGATGMDFVPKQGTLTFPAGTASGTAQAVTIAIVNDSLDETDQIVSVQLTSATGANLGAVQHTVTIVDDDPPPGLTINDVSVTEGPGATATFTVSLSAASTFTIGVDVATAPDTALNTTDFLPATQHLTFNPGETIKTFAVSIVDNDRAEPDEGFWVNLTAPTSATLTRSQGRGTIVDNEIRKPIDPALPGNYFPDITTVSGTSSYLPIFNPHTVPVTARLTYTRPNGSGVSRDFVVQARQRMTVDVGGEPGIGGTGDVSAVVQSTDTSRPLYSEYSSYWDADWHGGRNARGTATPYHTWTFAEGATGFFEEYLTVYNPSNVPINVVLNIYPTTGAMQTFSFQVPEGPGRIKIRVNDYIGAIDHGSAVTGQTLAGALSPIVVERTMFWGNGDRREGHSADGLGTLTGTYYFGEGATGAYSTFLALVNPSTTACDVLVHYLHENGVDYTQTGTIPAQGRLTLSPPGAVPAGAFAISVQTTNNVLFAADRSMYSGVNWKAGDSETASTITSTVWRFAEGATGSFFSEYLLLGNFTSTAAAVTLTFITETGQTITSNVTVPARGRTSVAVGAIPGLANTTFATEVTVTNGVPIMAERSMYWPSPWVAVHTSRGRP